MTYLWLPLAIMAILYIVSCIVGVIADPENYYDRSSFSNFVGYFAVLAFLVYGMISVGMLGHALVTSQ